MNEVAAAKELFQQASDILSYDLLQVCSEGLCDSSDCQLWQVPNKGSQVQDCQHHAGPKDKLNSTAVSQPAIYVASLAALEKLKQDEGQVSCMHAVMHLDPYSTPCPTRCAIQGALDAADVACGLSLGEYTALTFAGAMR